MKKLLPFLLALACCSPGNKETSLQDSTTVADSITLVNSDEGEEEPMPGDYADVVGDSSDLSMIYDSIKSNNEENSEGFYEVYISYNLYEASQTVKWLFDESFSPRYFNEDWAVEGNEGSTEYIIRDNEVICAQEIENAETRKWCQGIWGVKLTTTDENNTISEDLPADFGTTRNQDFNSKLDALKQILGEGEITQETEDSYTIRIEKVSNYGQDITETVEVTIPKKVWSVISGQ